MMERLTKRNGEMIWYNGEYNGQKLSFEPCEVMTDCSSNDIRKILHRLAAYEDTGFEPQDIEALKKLHQAEKEGRLVIPPCKVGDTLFDIYEARTNGEGRIRELKVTEIRIHLDKRNKAWLIIGGYYFAVDDFGQTVFLTYEEAGSALKKGVGHG